MAEETQARTWTEAPTSVTVRCTFKGFDVTLTLRGETGSEVLPKLEMAIAWLEQHGATPAATVTTDGTAASEPATEETHICPLHGAKMAKHEKQGDRWWSHRAYRPDGTEYWCRGSAEQ